MMMQEGGGRREEGGVKTASRVKFRKVSVT